MFSLPQSMQIYFCVVPVDMRRSFDTLAEIVRSSLGHEPRSGHLFVFRNKAEDCLKVLYWDKDGCATRGRSNMNGIKMPREPPFPVLT
jgi:transposase